MVAKQPMKSEHSQLLAPPVVCVGCGAAILRDDTTENHGSFHERCYRKWIATLYEEYRGTRCRKAKCDAK